MLLSAIALWATTAVAHADPGNYNQQGGKLVGAGAVGLAAQGSAVALAGDGNTALVAGYEDGCVSGSPCQYSSSGAVWVFTRLNGEWSQQGEKLANVGGAAVALSSDGNTAAIGAPGSNSGNGVYIFIRINGIWTQQGEELTGSGYDSSTVEGRSVALSADGNTLAFGAPGWGYSEGCGFDCYIQIGAVWVFTRSNGVWMQQGSLLTNHQCDGFSGGEQASCTPSEGESVSLSADGNTLAAGGDYSVWVYTRSNGVWSEPVDFCSVAVGPPPENGCSRYPASLTADGNTLLASGYSYALFTDVGQFFHRKGGAWTIGEQFPLLTAQSHPASSISQDGVTAVVQELTSTGAGSVSVFSKLNGTWTRYHSYAGSGAIGDASQGTSIALSADANTLLEGGPSDHGGVGAAWVFACPQLTIALTHAGNFRRGETGATYTITVTNAGQREIHSGAASQVQVTDTLPPGLSAAFMSGPGWLCDSLTCSRDDGLPVGASFQPITVTVNVASDAPPTVTNQAIVKGGGSRWGTATDPTTVTP